MSAIPLKKLSAVYTLHFLLELSSLVILVSVKKAPACEPGKLALLQRCACIFVHGTRVRRELIGASLSEPHHYVTTLIEFLYVCMYVCMYVWWSFRITF